MPYARLSLMSPHAEHHDELLRLHEELLRSFKKMPGYLGGYLLAAADESGHIGRFTLWASQHDADHASQDDHVMAVRSEMRAIAGLHEEGIDLDAMVEQGFDARAV